MIGTIKSVVMIVRIHMGMMRMNNPASVYNKAIPSFNGLDGSEERMGIAIVMSTIIAPIAIRPMVTR